MAIPAIHIERLERSLAEHETALKRTDRPLGIVAVEVHEILLKLGRNEDILALIHDFVDSGELADELRHDGPSILRARGIELPEGVTIRVVDTPGNDGKPTLRAEVRVRHVTVFADWDPELGVSTQVQRPPAD